ATTLLLLRVLRTTCPPSPYTPLFRSSIARGTRKPRVLLRGLRSPLGLAWRGRTLFISEEGRLERTVLSRGHLVSRKVLVSRLPFGEHQQDNLVFGRHGRLYLGSGSTCDAC